MSDRIRDLLVEMRQRQDDHLDAMDGKTTAWWGDIVSDNIILLDAVEAVLDRACMEQDDAESAMTYAAQIDDGLMLASQQARKQAWADAARAITTALEAS